MVDTEHLLIFVCVAENQKSTEKPYHYTGIQFCCCALAIMQSSCQMMLEEKNLHASKGQAMTGISRA